MVTAAAAAATSSLSPRRAIALGFERRECFVIHREHNVGMFYFFKKKEEKLTRGEEDLFERSDRAITPERLAPLARPHSQDEEHHKGGGGHGGCGELLR